MSNKEQLWAAFAARHAEAVWQAEERRERVYRENPVLWEMDRAITAAGSRYCIANLTGGEAEAAKAELEHAQQRRKEFLDSLHADLEPHFRCENCRDTRRTHSHRQIQTLYIRAAFPHLCKHPAGYP